LLLIFGWVEQVLFFCAHITLIHRSGQLKNLSDDSSLTFREVGNNYVIERN